MQWTSGQSTSSVTQALRLIHMGNLAGGGQMLTALAEQGDVPAMEQAGKLALQCHHLQDALYWSRMALRAGETASRLNDLGLVQMTTGSGAEAEASFRRAIETAPSDPAAYCHLGRLRFAAGAQGEGIALLRKSVACDAGYAPGQLYLGYALLDAGDAPGAEGALRAAQALNREDAMTLCLLAKAELALGKNAAALESCHQALKRQPNTPMVIGVLGTLYYKLGQPDQALACFRKYLTLQPGAGEGYNNCGTVYLKMMRPEDAIRCFRRALSGPHPFPAAAINLGSALQQSGQLAEALQVFRKAGQDMPDNPGGPGGEGIVERALGHIGAAYNAFLRAITLAPQMPVYYRWLLSLGRAWPLPAAETETLKKLENQASQMPLSDRAELHFALYQVALREADDAGAIRHLLAANAARRKTVRYDEAAARQLTARQIEQTPAALFRHPVPGGDPSRLPVFIVGMPRSGTSLLEQALAAHPAVFGAGEIMDFSTVLGCRQFQGAPEVNLADLSADDRQRLAKRYLKALRGHAAGAEGVLRIVNKQPWNFRLLGHIHQLLPGAQILHIHRDAMDCCFSCFEQNFVADLDFSYDQRELGHAYRDYERMMAHWREVLPEGAFLDISYEKLVTDFEPEMRRVLNFCGLSWDPACLAFQNAPRAVLTASAVQVRRPLYQTSVGRWKKYRKELVPLRNALAEEEPE